MCMNLNIGDYQQEKSAHKFKAVTCIQEEHIDSVDVHLKFRWIDDSIENSMGKNKHQSIYLWMQKKAKRISLFH